VRVYLTEGAVDFRKKGLCIWTQQSSLDVLHAKRRESTQPQVGRVIAIVFSQQANFSRIALQAQKLDKHP
jgi:hypothetical protein